MRAALIAALTVTTGLFCAFRNPGSAQNERAKTITQNAQGNQRPANQSPRSANGPTANEKQNPRSTVTPDNNTQSVRVLSVPPVPVQSMKDRYDKALVICTGLLVIVGFFQIVFLWRTVNATRDNAIALINSERAWIMVEVSSAPGWGTKIHSVEGSHIEAGTQVNTTSLPVRIVCRNEGKSPAWITEKRICVRIINGLPSAIPDLDNIEIREHEPEPVAIGKEPPPWDITPSCNGQEGMGEMTIIYGVVKYRDVFSDGHTTVFGYRLTPDSQLRRLEGLPEYNKNT